MPADDWLDENLEAIAQLSTPPKVSRPSLWVTVVTLLPFAVLLSWMTGWGWEQTALIVVLVVIHEAGHLIAKKAFGYTDLQLFFIPFIGAAVSGRKDDASQVQRALVALAGPLPSVIVSGAYLIAFHRGLLGPSEPNEYLQYPLGVRIAVITLIINGFNLIPLGPLDGGQFFSAILFSRRPWMDTACKIAAVAALVFIGIGSVWISFGIAAFMVMTLQDTHNIAVMSSKLRAAGLNQDPSVETMPLERLMQSYALTRQVIPDSGNKSLEYRVALRAGLLQRAYPGALAQPASASWVALLMALYLTVGGLGGYAWYLHDKGVKAAEEQRQEEANEHQFKIY